MEVLYWLNPEIIVKISLLPFDSYGHSQTRKPSVMLLFFMDTYFTQLP